jgi:opacity protein-like surface antigen
MWKLKIIFFFLLLVFRREAFAQISFGFYGGIDLANLHYDYPTIYIYQSSTTNDIRPGILSGCFLEINIIYNFSLESGFRYIQKGNKYNTGTYDATQKVTIKSVHSRKLSYIELPLCLKYKFNIRNLNLYLSAGASFGSNIKAEERVIMNEYSVFTFNQQELIQKKDVSLELGIGSEYKFKEKTWVFLNVQYSGGIYNIHKQSENAYSKVTSGFLKIMNQGILIFTGLKFEI